MVKYMPSQRTTTVTGVVAFAFAKREDDLEPNPCNERIAENVIRIVSECEMPVYVVAQWEVAQALRSRGLEPDETVDNRSSGGYLDSEGVWAAARSSFRALGLTDVIAVAQPFLHLGKVRRIIRADGYRLPEVSISSIGFDNSGLNLQWWTRGPVRLFIYAARQLLFGIRGGRRARQ
jgi:hypothetical protein